MKWDYLTFKCGSAKAVSSKMAEMRLEGWEFQLVYKVEGGFVLQVKRKKDEQQGAGSKEQGEKRKT
jgi:hypothetical protein